MEWFTAATVEDLKNEYRQLAKKHHPDLGGNTEDMQEINAEFDRKFERLNNPNRFTGMRWDDDDDISQSVREKIIILVRNEKFKEFWDHHTIGTDTGKVGYGIPVYTSKDIDTLTPGFATITGIDDYTIQNIQISIPDDIAEFCRDGYSGTSKIRKYYQSDIAHGKFSRASCAQGEFYMDTMWMYGSGNQKVVNAYFMHNGVWCSTKVYTKAIRNLQVEELCDCSDLLYLTFQDCTRDEFIKYHDTDSHDHLPIQKGMHRIIDDFWFIQDPLVHWYARNGIIEFFEHSSNFRLRYGRFHLSTLHEHLHETTIEDVELVQDFLSEMNNHFNDTIRSKIRKGKISMKI